MIDSPVPALDHPFDYAIPDHLVDDIVVGARVRVPLRSGGRRADAYVIELAEQSDFDGQLSAIDELVSPIPVLTPEVWRLARRAADRAAGTASDIVRLAVPKRHVRVEKAWLAAEEPKPLSIEPPAVEGYADPDRLTAPGTRSALSAIPTLAETDAGVTVGRWAATVAQLAARVLATGRSTIVCVPDYRDQDQLQSALADCVPAHAVSRLDARQSAAERYRAFLECLRPGPRVIIGNRSTIYAPAAELGLILVWDDADDLHAEPLAPYVHTRDAALIRQEDSGCALILAGHTRSVEAQRLVELGWLTAVEPARTTSPRVILSDPAQTGETARIPSAAWRAAREALAHGPVLVQVSRPGYAPVVACQRCHTAARCRTCHGPLGIRSAGAAPSCALCGAIQAGWACDECGATQLRLVTRGTGRTTEELGRAFPGTMVVTSDGEHRVERVPARPALVVATRGAEPVADGGYHAILLLDGERMLAREALSIAMDCLRWWANAAALSAPRAPVVLVGVGGRLGQALATWTPESFAAAELADRRELAFPPAVRTASVSGDLSAVERAIDGVDPALYRDVLGPTELPDGGVRSVVRFDYAKGAALAAAMRAAIIANTTTRRRTPAAKGGYRPPPSLRIRFDETEILQ
ncbi:hypothetical protein [Microbacterium humi]|nr:hypothetical protein [Microbacterium humi]